jgi:hypothetical protein
MTTVMCSSWITLGWTPPDGADVVTWAAAPIIDLTEVRCRALGAQPPRNGTNWAGSLGCYRETVAGVQTAALLGINAGSLATVRLRIWDPVTMTLAANLTVTVNTLMTGAVLETGTFTIPSSLAAGRYACALVITWPAGDTWIHCSGRLDVLPKVPS